MEGIYALFDSATVQSMILGYPLEQIILVTALLMFLNSLIMMPSSELVCTTVGFALYSNAHSVSAIGVVVTVAAAANLLGTFPYYALGYSHSKARASRKVISETPSASSRIFTWATEKTLKTDFNSIVLWFEKRGARAAFFVRLFPVIRSIASFPIGASGLRPLSFIISTFAGMVLWSYAWLLIGYFTGAVSADLIVPVLFVIGLVVVVRGRYSLAEVQKILRGRFARC